MPYLKKTVIAGDVMRVEKHYSARAGIKGITKQKKQKKTSEQMQMQNQRNAIKNLADIINTNFGAGDMHIVLTYAREYAPDAAEAKKQLDKFLRKARGVYRKQGKELKYIAVTEYRNKRIHHHLIANAMDARLLQNCWNWGRVRPTYIDDRKDHIELARYLVKETAKTYAADDAPQKQRYTCSKNLRKPVVKTERIRAVSWRSNPKVPKGYRLVGEVYNGFDAVGFPVQEYRMVRII